LLFLASKGYAQPSDTPSKQKLLLTGVALALPTYALGVALHEGSHALMGHMVGATIVDYRLTPGFHPRNKKFYFGYVQVRGLRNTRQRALFLLAPKLTNTLLLGGFAALYQSDSLPSNAYANTALLVFATGVWIDFSKDILGFRKQNDLVKIYAMLGMKTTMASLPMRLIHIGLSVGAGYSLVCAYQKLFFSSAHAPQTPLLLPIWQQPF